MLYITERAVFRLVQPGGAAGGAPQVELIEVAPGVSVERDVLAHMDFAPLVRNVRPMPAALFCP